MSGPIIPCPIQEVNQNNLKGGQLFAVKLGIV